MLTLIINLMLTVIILFLANKIPHVSAVLTIFYVLCVFIMTLGISWILSGAAVFFRDISAIVSPLTIILMFMCPIFYPASMVPKKIKWIITVNPVSVIIEDARGSLLYGASPTLTSILYVFLVSLFIAILGYFLFMRSKDISRMFYRKKFIMNQDNIAVRVKGISKVYHLRGSTHDQFLFFLKRLITFLLPFKWLNLKKPISNHENFYALNDVSFDIRKGESWGFIGVNGSGKSTLLKIISGNLRPSAGHVEVDGKVVILNYGSGFNGDFTGKENIYMKATLMGLTKKQINDRYQSIVDFAELGDLLINPLNLFQRDGFAACFAIIAHVDADIIISDEVIAVGDVFRAKCMGFIRDFIKKYFYS